MTRLFFLIMGVAGLASAQTSETIPYRVSLSPANLVPPVAGLTGAGQGTLFVHVLRDSNGQISSGSVDFRITFQLPGSATFTSLQLQRGAAGQAAGDVVADAGLSLQNSAAYPSGAGGILLQGQILPSSTLGEVTPAQQALRDLVANPSSFNVTLRSTEYPDGVLRGPLQRADMVVLANRMSPANEVPPIENATAGGYASIVAVATKDATGAYSSGLVTFLVNYDGVPTDAPFTGLHIHAAPAGSNGPVTISSGIGSGAAAVPVSEFGSGLLRYDVEVPQNRAAQDTLNGLFTNPANYYVNIHTTTYPNGFMRAQLRRTERVSFSIAMLPTLVNPPLISSTASSWATINAYLLRNSDGTVDSGVINFDVNYRFPEAVQITGLRIHDGAPGAIGLARIDSLITANAAVTSTPGSGNIYRWVNAYQPSEVASLNQMLLNPDLEYVQLTTATSPFGATRGQLASYNPNLPTVLTVISSVSDRNRHSSAPLGLVTVFGSNITKVEGDLTGINLNGQAPLSLNGTSVLIGGYAAPIVKVLKDQVVAQVPAEVPDGPQPVVVRNSNGTSIESGTVTISRTSPGLFFDAESGIALKNDSYALVRANNPARAGDILVLYATGLGQTTPALTTGQLVPMGTTLYSTAPVTVQFAGVNAEVIYSIASPGTVGLYQIAVRVPTGINPGVVPVTISQAGGASNTVTLNVQ